MWREPIEESVICITMMSMPRPIGHFGQAFAFSLIFVFTKFIRWVLMVRRGRPLPAIMVWADAIIATQTGACCGVGEV